MILFYFVRVTSNIFAARLSAHLKNPDEFSAKNRVKFAVFKAISGQICTVFKRDFAPFQGRFFCISGDNSIKKCLQKEGKNTHNFYIFQHKSGWISISFALWKTNKIIGQDCSCPIYIMYILYYCADFTRACSTSARMSSTSSIPTEKRMRSS